MYSFTTHKQVASNLMKCSFLFFLLTILSYQCAAQQKEIDSLVLALKMNAKQDTNLVKTLNTLAYSYYAIDPENGIKTAERAIVLGKKLNFVKGLATSYSYKGHNYSAQGQDSMALVMYDVAMGLHRQLNNTKAIARLVYNQGLVYFNQSNYSRANDYNKQAYEVFKKEKDSFLMAKMLNSIGINQMYLSQYPEALSSYLESKRIYEDLKNTEDIQYASIHANIGLLYARLEKPDLAMRFQEKALALFEKVDFQEGIANSITNIGRLYTAMGKPQKALLNYKEAFKIMEANSNERGMASALTNTGIAYTKLGAYKKAIPYFERTKVIYERLKNSNNLAIVHDNLGNCFMNLPTIKNLVRAEENYFTAFEYAKEAGSLNLQFEALDNLALVQTKKGNYKKAYKNKTDALVLRDSFNSVEKKEEIARLEAKYEYEQEKSVLQAGFDKEQAVSEAEVVRQKLVNRVVMLGALFVLLVSFVGFFLYKKRKDALAEKKISDFRTKVAETELKALRSQMNPHFIFNSLNSISDYMEKNDVETASEYLMKFAKLTRSILENSEKKWITLKEDLELTKLYIEIEALRLKDKLFHTIKVDESIDVENTLVPPMLLQPFIENSIWHGIAAKKTKGLISIEIKIEDQMVVCIVEDDGVGRKKTRGDDYQERESMGIKITKNRLDIISQLKGVQGSIAMFDKKQGLRVELKLPLELNF